MNKFLVICILAFTSCCQTHVEVTYSFNGVIIKRLDECGKTTFYYGEKNKKATQIWAEYSGINSGFSGYLKFLPNGKVYLLCVDGYYQTLNADTSKFKYVDEWYYEFPEKDSATCFVQRSYKGEQNTNKENHSKVKAVYNDKSWFDTW